MTHRKYIDFNASTVPLQESNLIEASAGTGKTYSIAILVLRLVLEQQLPVKNILMVTFTKAAVAELESRVRLFIRTAYKASLGKPVHDENIKALVDKAIAVTGENDIDKGTTVIQQVLRDAVLLLDETSVLTIHGFCQQTLLEFTFETDQPFGAELITDSSALLEVALNHFWRRHLTTLDAGLLEHVWYDEMKGKIQQLVKEHLDGKHYLGFDPGMDYSITTDTQKKWLKDLARMDAQERELKDKVYAFAETNHLQLKALVEGNTHAKRNLLTLVGKPPAFIDFIEKNRDKVYIQKLFPDILKQIDAWSQVNEERNELLNTIHRQLYGLAIKEISEMISLYKERNNIMGYDDLIADLHAALVQKDNPSLEAMLRKKYKAVFVDEFQDTDRQQYEIFDKAFGRDTILFYIGDPKQSIYGWRKADIFTYFQAKNKVQQLYGMNQNFRSSARYIEAMNLFFLPSANFDTFYFSQEKDAIEYIPVESPLVNTKGSLLKGDQPAIPLSIRTVPKKEIAASSAAMIADLLLNRSYQINTEKETRGLKASDIGVLVRTGKQGREIKAALSRIGIPAVTLDDSKVLQSDEAGYLLYLLEAVEEPDRTTINRALLSPFTGYTINDILLLDDEAVMNLFRKYKIRWLADGIYAALMDFMTDFGVREVLLRSNTENGERIITNFMQLAELVHQIESRKSLSTIEIIAWLKRHIDGMATEGDEYTQRVENDEEAVKIVTIHKCKGLEYNIVLAPFLEFTTDNRFEFVSFRHPATGEYVSVETNRLTEEQLAWQRQQAEQENRRLLYVALTRAIYTCYIYKSDNGKPSTLSAFTDALPAAGNHLIVYEMGGLEAPAGSYRIENSPNISAATRPVLFSLQQPNWRRLSYTMLAAKPLHLSRPNILPGKDVYETFVFQTLRAGTKTGDLLHFLMENIHFSDDSRWDKWIEESIRRFAPAQRELYLSGLRRMLTEILNARIQINGTAFTLSSINRNKRISEFEFDFPVSLFNPSDLNRLTDASVSVIVKDFSGGGAAQLEGIMTGIMDLFFEHDGRYYILDWKTTHLGTEPANYSTPALAEAMRDNNYHLQYLIYTLAAKKYLQSRLPDFNYGTQFGGVIYFFVRGARKGSENGIYTVKPAIETLQTIEEMIIYSPSRSK
jgi:exodeoxyribonuclease V beta subunit